MIYENSLSFVKKLDQSDPLRFYRKKFHYPKNKKGNEVLYLCSNSLGLQPKTAKEFIEKELNVWEKDGVLGQHGRWEKFHERLIHPSARLVGAKPSEVVVMNALTVNIHLLLISFYQPTKTRNKIMIEKGAFPSDQYAVESQIRLHGFNPKECLVELAPRNGEKILRTDDILKTINENGDELCTILLGGVNYYTGQAFDMKAITEAGKSVGAFVGFDLAHAAGNLLLNLHEWNVDFAAWCSYKYLCAGPGAPSGIFIHERHHDWDGSRLAGWWGQNKQTRFEMGPEFDPIQTAEGWQISNSPVMGMTTLLASMEIFEEAGMKVIREKGIEITGYLEYLIQNSLPNVTIITPNERGCQLSLVVPGGRKVFDTISEKSIICDWREPDVIRIAPHPLFNTFLDIFCFVEILKKSI
ncbi:MAG: kynureninase [Candidatus Marinimicrobia bacterium]|jgi:kynureninase|nr:kynureninase [Candidatus Neomarinimicrobiota bacterium]MBT4054142.1 kynureninase [Candidatus Neomarinimicrobiota bacterium]MBT5722151.1 kynureninase [Candidatus Neomarinimicrobiota bacterium]MBT6516588.1 kynureninase [Candidatus Neomarinimicrobiota bacterium]MBT6981081.1 kynureninase [Candidatus Neomarinimicrobiota bacterium]